MVRHAGLRPRTVEERSWISRRGEDRCVEAASIVVEGELLLARPPRSTAGRRSRRQADVIQDPARDAFVLDDADQLHALATARTRENVEIPGAAHERGPREPSLALGIIGSSEGVYVRHGNSNSVL